MSSEPNAFYGYLADAIVVGHLAYVAFALGGFFVVLLGAAMKWEWVRNRTFRLVHLASVLIVAVEAVFGVVCPLTNWERDLRRAAGQYVDGDISFIGRLTRDVLFYEAPPWVFTTSYVVFGVVVLATFVLAPPRWKKGRSPESAS